MTDAPETGAMNRLHFVQVFGADFTYHICAWNENFWRRKYTWLKAIRKRWITINKYITKTWLFTLL